MSKEFAVYTGKSQKKAIWFCGWAQGGTLTSGIAQEAKVFPNRWIAEDAARILGRQTKKEWEVMEVEGEEAKG